MGIRGSSVRVPVFLQWGSPLSWFGKVVAWWGGALWIPGVSMCEYWERGDSLKGAYRPHWMNECCAPIGSDSE
jgi:hypothetical protein